MKKLILIITTIILTASCTPESLDDTIRSIDGVVSNKNFFQSNEGKWWANETIEFEAADNTSTTEDAQGLLITALDIVRYHTEGCDEVATSDDWTVVKNNANKYELYASDTNIDGFQEERWSYTRSGNQIMWIYEDLQDGNLEFRATATYDLANDLTFSCN